jgi:hypothetical protein
MNFVQELSKRKTPLLSAPSQKDATPEIPPEVEKPPLLHKASASKRLQSKIGAPPENPFDCFGKLIDMSLNYDKLFHLESVVADIKDAFSFDTFGFHYLPSHQLDMTQVYIYYIYIYFA